MRHRREPFTYVTPEASNPPMQRVGRMPMTLMRNSLVTRDPAQMEEALADYENEAPAVDFMLPQRAQWQQWKSDTVDLLNGNANRPRHAHPLQRVEGLVEAMLTGRAMDYLTHLPSTVYPIAQAAIDHSSGFYDEPMDESPMLFRDAPAQGRPIPPPAIGQGVVPLSELPERARGQGIARSLQDVALNQRRVESYLLSEVRGRR